MKDYTINKKTDKGFDNLSRKKLRPIIAPISIIPAYISQPTLSTPTLALSGFQILPIKSTLNCSLASSSEIPKDKDNLCTSNVLKKTPSNSEQHSSPHIKISRRKKLSSAMSPSEIKREIVSPDFQLVPSDCNTSSPSLSVASPLGKSDSQKRFTKETTCTNQTYNSIEESYLRLTTMIEQYLENRNRLLMRNNSMDEEDIFVKTIADQLRKTSEPKKTIIKGQIMKVLYEYIE